MKKSNFKFILLFLVIGIFFISCSNDDLTVNPVLAEENIEISANVLKNELVDFIAPDGKSYLVTKNDLLEINKIISKRRTGAITSSFVPGTTSTSIIHLASNVVIFVTDSRYATGNYLCDTYKSEGSTTVASGSFVLFDPSTAASIVGLTAPISGAGEGSVNFQTGNTYSFRTHSYIPKYNIIGYPVSRYTIPRDLTGNIFSFTVFTP